MDTITQAVVGALIGESTVGHRRGYPAVLWGAALATLPDLDVLANPWLETTEQLVFHRGPSHSLLLLALLGPPIGLALARLHGDREREGWRGTARWMLLATLALWSQPLIDVLTSYGTHILWPISRLPYAFSAISIIDPIFTTTIVVGLVAALLSELGSTRRRRIGRVTAGLAVGYLALCIGLKLHARDVFDDELARQEIVHEELVTMPGILNSVLWVGMADAGEVFHVGLYSVLDDDRRVPFLTIDKRRELLAPYEDDRRVRTLVRFSQGFYVVRREESDLIFEVLHIGRRDQWINVEDRPVFRYRLVTASEPETKLVEVRELAEPGGYGSELVQRYFRRVLGDESVVRRPSKTPPSHDTESTNDAQK